MTTTIRRAVTTRSEWYGDMRAAMQVAAAFGRNGVPRIADGAEADDEDTSGTLQPLLPRGQKPQRSQALRAQEAARKSREKMARLEGSGGEPLPVDDLDEKDVRKSRVELSPVLFLRPLPCTNFRAANGCTSGPTCAACTRDGIHLLNAFQASQVAALRGIVASLSDCVSSQV